MEFEFDHIQRTEVRDDGQRAQLTLAGKAGDQITIELTADKIGPLVTRFLGLASAMRINRQIPSDTPEAMRNAEDVLIVKTLAVEMSHNPQDTGLIFIIETLDGRHCQVALSHPLGRQLREALQTR